MKRDNSRQLHRQHIEQNRDVHRCPNCGAPFPGEICNYCGTEMTPVKPQEQNVPQPRRRDRAYFLVAMVAVLGTLAYLTWLYHAIDAQKGQGWSPRTESSRLR